MTIVKEIEIIKQTALPFPENSEAWKHHKDIMEQLEKFGALNKPEPKTFATDGCTHNPATDQNISDLMYSQSFYCQQF